MVEVSLVSKFHEDDEKLKKVLSLINHSWAPQIMHRLDTLGKMRYNELKASLRGVSSTSLSRALGHLTGGDVIRREVTDSNPPQVYYSLTGKGKSLSKMFLEALDIEKETSGAVDEEIPAVAK